MKRYIRTSYGVEGIFNVKNYFGVHKTIYFINKSMKKIPDEIQKKIREEYLKYIKKTHTEEEVYLSGNIDNFEIVLDFLIEDVEEVKYYEDFIIKVLCT